VGFVYSDVLQGGGYPRDVRWLAGALQRNGVEVTLFGRNTSHQSKDGLVDGIELVPMRKLRDFCSSFDLIHIFGIFLLNHPLAARRCLAKSVPLVVSPMVHLMPRQLEVNRIKKYAFLRVAWTELFKRVSAFHVFSEIEARSVREFEKDAAIFEGTSGVFPGADGNGNTGRVNRKVSARQLLFFGRNDVNQKGLDFLIKGFAKAVNKSPRAQHPIRLRIVGQPWDGSTPYLRKTIRQLGIEELVEIVGPVDEASKWRILTQADYLIFLSRWDGPPRPIREAIVAGLPVIVSPETNMGDLVEQFGAGLQVPLEVNAIADAIARSSDDEDLLERCRVGIAALRAHLDWTRVAQDYISGYERVLNRHRNDEPVRVRNDEPVRILHA
jgi:glycosyltransferase involved in cell wall biosynthesis